MKQIFEFINPIQEARQVGDDFLISGVAINETTTRNGIKYVGEELDKSAKSFRSKPLLIDHRNEVMAIVGRITERVFFDKNRKALMFEAKVIDKVIQTKINQGLITDVSIGAGVKDLVEEEDGSKRAVQIEGMEISLVAIPGDSSANFQKNIFESFGKVELIKENFIQNQKGGKTEMEDETKGNVGDFGKEKEIMAGLVIEQADEGTGFQLWRDVTISDEIGVYDNSGQLVGTKKLNRFRR